MEFQVNGVNYRAGKLSAMQQFHIVRRIAPIISRIAEADPEFFAAARNETNALLRFLKPLTEAIAELSDTDCEYVLSNVLAVVQRQQGQAWGFIWNRSAKAPQFDDIDMGVMLQITMRVLEGSLASFFPASAPNSSAAPPRLDSTP